MSKLNKSLQLYKIFKKIYIINSRFFLILKFKILNSFYYDLLINSECNFIIVLKKNNLIKLKLYNSIYLNSFLIGFNTINEVYFFFQKYLIDYNLNLRLYYGILYTKNYSYNLDYLKKIELDVISINKNNFILISKLYQIKYLFVKKILLILLNFYSLFFIINYVKISFLSLINKNIKK